MWKLTWCINGLANWLRFAVDETANTSHLFCIILSRPRRMRVSTLVCGIITTFDKRIWKSTHTFSLRYGVVLGLCCRRRCYYVSGLEIYTPLWIDWVFRNGDCLRFTTTTWMATKTLWLRCDILKVETCTHSGFDWYFEVAEFDWTFKLQVPSVRQERRFILLEPTENYPADSIRAWELELSTNYALSTQLWLSSRQMGITTWSQPGISERTGQGVAAARRRNVIARIIMKC